MAGSQGGETMSGDELKPRLHCPRCGTETLYHQTSTHYWYWCSECKTYWTVAVGLKAIELAVEDHKGVRV